MNYYIIKPEYYQEKLKRHINIYPEYTILPEDAIDQKIQWFVSDDNLAMVDEEGCVILLAPGEVTLTATLHNGNTVSCLIQIAEGKE